MVDALVTETVIERADPTPRRCSPRRATRWCASRWTWPPRCRRSMPRLSTRSSGLCWPARRHLPARRAAQLPAAGHRVRWHRPRVRGSGQHHRSRDASRSSGPRTGEDPQGVVRCRAARTPAHRDDDQTGSRRQSLRCGRHREGRDADPAYPRHHRLPSSTDLGSLARHVRSHRSMGAVLKLGAAIRAADLDGLEPYRLPKPMEIKQIRTASACVRCHTTQKMPSLQRRLPRVRRARTGRVSSPRLTCAHGLRSRPQPVTGSRPETGDSVRSGHHPRRLIDELPRSATEAKSRRLSFRGMGAHVATTSRTA